MFNRGIPLADLAVVVASFGLFTVPVLAGTRAWEGSAPAIIGFGALAALPLLYARRAPVAAALIVGLVEVAAALSGVRFTVFVSNAGPVVPFAIAVVAARRDRRVSLRTTVVVVLAISVAQVLALGWYPKHDQDAVQFLLAIPAWLIGDSIRARRQYRSSLLAAEQQAETLTEARFRAEERLRLSRDVHDVVSHVLGMIAVRSGIARILLDDQPEEARRSLTEIERASRTALDELRTVLRSTRDSAETDVGMKSLADLPQLVAGTAGPAIEFEEIGRPLGYPPLVEHAMYRIAQESLTNVVRHAAATRVSVRLEHGEDAVSLSVLDDGRGVSTDGAGFGVPGMRERAELLGGELTAGPDPAGGFLVRARIPQQRSDDQ